MADVISIFRNRDPREVPMYSIGRAAHHIGVPASTVRAWAVGQPYLASQGRSGAFPPVIDVPPGKPPRLTFNNLAELFVLAALRRDNNLNLSAIRNAIENTRRSSNSAHPLLTMDFVTDGVKLYLQESGDRLLDVSSGLGGQYAIPAAIQSQLRRIEIDNNMAIRLYPLIQDDDHRPVVIDPEVSFGKPTINGTGVAVSVVAGFVKAGETPERVAREFGMAEKDVQAAAAWWHERAAA